MLTRFFRICPTIVNLDGTVPSVEVKTELSLVDPQSKYSAQFDVGEVFHCDGLLLCTHEDESRFVVWNPFTGETRWFQPSKTDAKVRRFVLGYYQEGNNKSYKVLSFYKCRKDYEIYDFNSDSWRVLDDIMDPGWSIGITCTNVSLKGSTYWFAKDITKPEANMSLARFDFATEKAVPVVPLPYQCTHYGAKCLSVVKDEKLSVLLKRNAASKTEIWVTNKIDETTQVVSWSKILALDLSPDISIADGATFLLDEEKKVVMICDTWFDFEDETISREMLYIVGEDNEVTHVDLGMDTTDGCGVALLNYVPSLAQIERAGGKRKRGDL